MLKDKGGVPFRFPVTPASSSSTPLRVSTTHGGLDPICRLGGRLLFELVVDATEGFR